MIYAAHSPPKYIYFLHQGCEKFVKGVPGILGESSVVAVFCKPEMTVGIARLPEFRRDDGILSGRGQVALLN